MLRKFSTLCFVVCLFFLLSSGQAPQRDPVDENPVLEELRTIADEETVNRFVAATEALDSGRFAEAETLYTEVLKRVPNFEPALRRLGYVYGSVGKRKEGLELTAKALSQNRSVHNLQGRVSLLLFSNSPGFEPSPAEIKEAESLAREAWQKSGDKDEDLGILFAETLLASKKYDEFTSLANTLKAKFPESGPVTFYKAMALAANDDLNAAEAEIARGKELGHARPSL